MKNFLLSLVFIIVFFGCEVGLINSDHLESEKVKLSNLTATPKKNEDTIEMEVTVNLHGRIRSAISKPSKTNIDVLVKEFSNLNSEGHQVQDSEQTVSFSIPKGDTRIVIKYDSKLSGVKLPLAVQIGDKQHLKHSYIVIRSLVKKDGEIFPYLQKRYLKRGRHHKQVIPVFSKDKVLTYKEITDSVCKANRGIACS